MDGGATAKGEMKRMKNKIHLLKSTWARGEMHCGFVARDGTRATKNRKVFLILKDERVCLRCKGKL